MSLVKNPLLFERLKKAFGYVRVSNPGAAITFLYRPDWLYRQGRLRAEVIDYGETYYVNCPFCTDLRLRLAVSHHWAVQESKTRDDMLHLARCFNEGCLATRRAQKELHAMVFPHGMYGHLAPVKLKPAKAAPAPVTPVFTMPRGESLSALPANHAAIQYLQQRRFNPAELEAKWEVIYCAKNSHPSPPFGDGRLVAPVYAPRNVVNDGGKNEPRLAGWTARLIPTPDASKHAPKYVSALGMKRNQLLYGLPQAIHTKGPVVVVEGVTDVWRLGKAAVALLGKTISPDQVHLIRGRFRGRPVAVLLDRDASQDAEKVRAAIVQARKRIDESPVVLASLPDGRDDPGECRRSEAWAAIQAALGKRSVG